MRTCLCNPNEPGLRRWKNDLCESASAVAGGDGLAPILSINGQLDFLTLREIVGRVAGIQNQSGNFGSFGQLDLHPHAWRLVSAGVVTGFEYRHQQLSEARQDYGWR